MRFLSTLNFGLLYIRIFKFEFFAENMFQFSKPVKQVTLIEFKLNIVESVRFDSRIKKLFWASPRNVQVRFFESFFFLNRTLT